MSSLTPEQRTLHARMAAHAMHSQHDSRETTVNARRKFLERFYDEVDPDRTLPAAERERRAEHARKRYFTWLALRSAQVRKRAA